MDSRLQVVAVALLALALFAVAWMILADPEEKPASSKEHEKNSLRGVGTRESNDFDSHAADDDEEHLPLGKERVEPHRIYFSGRVKNAVTGEPVSVFVLSLFEKRLMGGRRVPAHKRIDEEVESSEGEFSLRMNEGGHFDLFVKAPGFLSSRCVEIEISPTAGLSDYVIELTPTVSIEGLVVEDATSAPVPGVDVTAFLITQEMIFEGAGLRSVKKYGDGARTDGNGRFALNDLCEGKFALRARHRDFVQGEVDAFSGDAAVEIRLRKGYHVFGRVLDRQSRPVAGIKVVFRHKILAGACESFTDGEGHYRSPALPPGRLSLEAAPARFTDGATKGFVSEARRAEIVDRDVEVNFGLSAEHVTWRGVLYGSSGEPVPRGQIRLVRKSGQPRPESGAPCAVVRNERTDDSGAFEIEKLTPATFEIFVTLQGDRVQYNDSPLDEVTFERSGVIDRDIRLRATALSGHVIDAGTGKPIEGATCWVMARSEKALHYTADVDGTGRFRFGGIPPGVYSLTANGLDMARGRLENITLSASQTIDGLRLVVPLSGVLDLEVSGFEPAAAQGLDLTVVHLQSGAKSSFCNNAGGDVAIDETGLCRIVLNLQTGAWSLMLEHDVLGTREHPFHISSGQTTVVRLRAEDFSLPAADDE